MLNLQPLPFLFFQTYYHLFTYCPRNHYDLSGLVGMFVCWHRFPDGAWGHTWTELCFLYSFRFRKVVHYQRVHCISILCIFFWKISPTLKGILCEVHLRRDISSLWEWWYKSSVVEIQSFGTTWSCKFFNGTHCLQVGVMFGHVCCLLLFRGLADFRW